MAKLLTKKTFLKKLETKGIKLGPMTLWWYQQRGIFIPTQEIKYGQRSLPLFTEEQVDELYNIIIERFKTRQTKDKRIFINGVPKRLQTYRKQKSLPKDK